MALIYLDNNATTRVHDRVAAAALPFLTEQYGNASSTHAAGILAHQAVKAARMQVADMLHALPISWDDAPCFQGS